MCMRAVSNDCFPPIPFQGRGALVCGPILSFTFSFLLGWVLIGISEGTNPPDLISCNRGFHLAFACKHWYHFFSDLSDKMPSVYGARLTTFEDSDKESEYGYVRKVHLPSRHSSCFLFLICWHVQLRCLKGFRLFYVLFCQLDRSDRLPTHSLGYRSTKK